MPSSTGSNHDDLLEVLTKYDDVRKIPVFVTIMKSGYWDTGWPPISEQLAKLGAPAARAILEGCAVHSEDYGDWAGTTIGWMHETLSLFSMKRPKAMTSASTPWEKRVHNPAAKPRKSAAHGASLGSDVEEWQAPKGRKKTPDKEP